MKNIKTWTVEWCEPEILDNAKMDEALFLKEVSAESIGWLHLDNEAYLHLGAGTDAAIIEVVGVADATHADQNALLLNW